MNFSPCAESCLDCPHRVVCRCLQVTEAAVVDAIDRFELKTIKELVRHTGAGSGCTCCHGELREYLEQHKPAALPLAG